MNELLAEITSVLGLGASAREEATKIVKAAHQATPADPAGSARAMATRRASGEPLAYVIDTVTFMGVDLIASAGVLIPRIETEPLGNEAIDVLRSSGLAAPKVIDMCCGSGNLACGIAHHLSNARVWASDLTDDCVALARRNVHHVGVSDRVVVSQGDLFGGLARHDLEGSIDTIVCGPPFISHHKLATESAGLLKYEPREAFDGGPYGLSIQQRVVSEALPFLRPGGTLMFETGLGQERPAKMLFDRSKAYEDVRVMANASGEIRVISARKRWL